MLKRIVPRALLGVLAAVSIGMAASTPVLAYGPAAWQLTFSGTGPGFGFWGWCDLAGATNFNAAGQATSGTSGDCQFAEYAHNLPGFPSGTCEISFNLTPELTPEGTLSPAWRVGPITFYPGLHDWFFSGTQVIHPANLTSICEHFLGVSPTPTFSNFDSVLPVVVGHANLSGVFGTTELQLQETPLP
jgi:hypothetical protein